MTTLHTQGTQFLRGTGAPLVYTLIAGIQNAPLPDEKRKTHDTTTMDQAPSVGGDATHATKVGGLVIETGAVELELLCAPDGVGIQQLRDDMRTADPVPYRTKLRDGTHYSYMGLVTNIKPEGKMDDLFKFKVSIEVSGKATKGQDV